MPGRTTERRTARQLSTNRQRRESLDQLAVDDFSQRSLGRLGKGIPQYPVDH